MNFKRFQTAILLVIPHGVGNIMTKFQLSVVFFFSGIGTFWANSICPKRNRKAACLCDKRGNFPSFTNKKG